MTRRLARLSAYIYRHVCYSCERWIWRNNHRGEHASCAHVRRIGVANRHAEGFAPMRVPQWVSPCPVCGVAL